MRTQSTSTRRLEYGRLLFGIFAAVVSCLGLATGAEQGADVPSPGQLALMALEPLSPANLMAWHEAFVGDDLHRRAAAARAITAAGAMGVLPQVRAAQKVEKDPHTLLELLRARMLLGDDDDRAQALVALDELPSTLRAAALSLHTSLTAPDSLALLTTAIEQSTFGTKAETTELVRSATRLEKTRLERSTELAVQHHNLTLLAITLDLASEADVELSPERQVALLGNDDRRIQTEVAWHLARHYATRARPAHADALLAHTGATTPDASTAEADGGVDSRDPDARFGSVLLERVLGSKATEAQDWIEHLAAKGTTRLTKLDDYGELLDHLTRGERKALETRYDESTGQKYRVRVKHWRESERQRKSQEKGIGRLDGAAHQLVDFPPGYVVDVVRAAGCPADQDDSFGSAEITYQRSGRPANIRLLGWPSGGDGCKRAVTALFATSLRPATLSASDSDSPLPMVVFLDAERATCSDDFMKHLAATNHVSSFADATTPPVAVEQPSPAYPKGAMRSGVPQLVTFDAVITPDGCVTNLVVTEGQDLRFQLAAMASASRWRFEPARADDNPIAVEFKLTINFTSTIDSTGSRLPTYSRRR